MSDLPLPSMQSFNNDQGQNDLYLQSFARLIQKINRRVNSGTYSTDLLNFVFEALEWVIPFDRIGIAMVEPSGKRISLKWARAKGSLTHLTVGYSEDLESSSLNQIIKTGRPRIIADLLSYSHANPASKSTELIVKDGIRSSLTCPLRRNNTYVGVVFFSSLQPHCYDAHHISAFLDIAEELSFILDHERLQNHENSTNETSKNLAVILHDLRSPLSTMQGFVNLSLEQTWFNNLPAEARDVFKVLQRNAAFMASLLRDLEQLNHLEGCTDLSVNFREVDLNVFCRELEGTARILSAEKDIRFEFMAVGIPEKGTFDPDKIRRAFDNLISNAVKFSKRKSKIIAKVEATQKTLFFSVEDQGPGIPESDRVKLFQYFGRASTKPTEGERSTGLGLAIVKRVIDLHRGSVDYETVLGKGSVFRFSIPLNPL